MPPTKDLLHIFTQANNWWCLASHQYSHQSSKCSDEWNQNLQFSAFQNRSEQQWPLLSSVSGHHQHPDGHCCLHPGHFSLISYSSHCSHHNIGPLSKLIARVHSCCRVKVGNSHSFIRFSSLGRFEKLSCVHLELRKYGSFHHSVVLVHDVFP